MAENPRWKRRPPGSTWGDWGPDDQLGRLNLLTPDKVLKGIAEVKEGRTFCLSLPLDYPGGTVVNPRRHPPRLLANKRNGMPYIAYPLAREDPKLIDVVCDDIVEMTLQYSTQWDSLAHVGQLFDADGEGKPEIVFYTATAPARTSSDRWITATAGRSSAASMSAHSSCRSTTWRRTACRAAA